MFISSLVLVLYRLQIAFPDVDLLEEDFLLNIWQEDNIKVVNTNQSILFYLAHD
jgi:hypothetical protein